jgi:hypothetical protein
MYGLWYERTVIDLIREGIIHLVLTALYVPAFRAKCMVSLVIITVIGLQHLASLFLDPDGFLPQFMEIPGALLLAAMGYFKNTNILLFAGIYSAVSKVEILKLCPDLYQSLGDNADMFNEISKLIVALLLFVLVVRVFLFQKIYRMATNDPSWTYKPDWLFEGRYVLNRIRQNCMAPRASESESLMLAKLESNYEKNSDASIKNSAITIE